MYSFPELLETTEWVSILMCTSAVSIFSFSLTLSNFFFFPKKVGRRQWLLEKNAAT